MRRLRSALFLFYERRYDYEKKLFLTSVVVALSVLFFGAVSACAATEGYFTYEISNDEVIITRCDVYASGDIIVPAKLGGYPVTAIGEFAFASCSNIKSIYIHPYITSIDDYAFYDCYSLSSIKIPENVTSIGAYAFQYCSGLTSIDIPSSVTTIGWNAFYVCTGITKVNITDLAAWCNIDFKVNYSNPLYYAHNLYLNGKLIEELIIPDSITALKQYVFYYCTGITSVSFHEKLTYVGEYAFYECDNLTDIYYFGTEKQFKKIDTDFTEKTFSNASILFPSTTSFIFNDGHSFNIGVKNGGKNYTGTVILALYNNDKFIELLADL